jgi:hypothetical protein
MIYKHLAVFNIQTSIDEHHVLAFNEMIKYEFHKAFVSVY